MRDYFMNMAFIEADCAFDLDEVPIGAVIVKDGNVIAKAHNSKERDKCVCSHAELLAISLASQVLNNWRLDDCDIYVTLDPCPMCASAIKQARIRNVYSALSNKDEGNSEIISSIFKSDDINPKVNFYSNLSVDEAKNNLKRFFESKRK